MFIEGWEDCKDFDPENLIQFRYFVFFQLLNCFLLYTYLNTELHLKISSVWLLCSFLPFLLNFHYYFHKEMIMSKLMYLTKISKDKKPIHKSYLCFIRFLCFKISLSLQVCSHTNSFFYTFTFNTSWSFSKNQIISLNFSYSFIKVMNTKAKSVHLFISNYFTYFRQLS